LETPNAILGPSSLAVVEAQSEKRLQTGLVCLEWYDRQSITFMWTAIFMFITNLKNVVVQWKRSNVRGSVMLQEYQGFHIFSEIVLLFFDFLVEARTTTKLGPKYLEKIKKIFRVHSATFQKWSW